MGKMGKEPASESDARRRRGSSISRHRRSIPDFDRHGCVLGRPDRKHREAHCANMSVRKRCRSKRRGRATLSTSWSRSITSRDLNGAELAAKCEPALETAQAKVSSLSDGQRAAWRAKWDASRLRRDRRRRGHPRLAVQHLSPADRRQRKRPRAQYRRQVDVGRRLQGPRVLGHGNLPAALLSSSPSRSRQGAVEVPLSHAARRDRECADERFKGAQYAWESADTGAETTPKWTADGANRIWTGEEEIHVTACVAFGILSYVTATGDQQFMRDSAPRVLYQTSRFWVSRLEWNEAQDRFELTRVIGPTSSTNMSTTTLSPTGWPSGIWNRPPGCFGT